MAEIVNSEDSLKEFWGPYIQDLTRKQNPIRWSGYDEAVEHAEALAPHVFAEKPAELLEIARPNEPTIVKKYRLESYQPETTTEEAKIENVIRRIFTPGNFSIRHKDAPAGIKAEYAFSKIMEKQFSRYHSVLNFTSDVCLHQSLGDPNSLLAIFMIPDYYGELKPQALIFDSKKVLDFIPGIRAVVLSEEKSSVLIGNTYEFSGNVLFLFLKNMTVKVIQTGLKEDNKYEFVILHNHDMDFLPCRPLGGNIELDGEKIYYQSFIAGVIPHWNKAIMIQSDLDAYRTLHMFPKFVQVSIPCSTCRGTGLVTLSDGDKDTCGTCKGTKVIAGVDSPYASLSIDPKDLNGLGVNDTMAYISPPSNIITEARTEIKYHIERGFSAVNMDVLNAVPEDQSGIAKAIDRQDLIAFLSDIAGHFYDLMEWIYFTTAKMLYGGMFSDEEIREKIMPEISRPVKFDYVSADAILHEAKLVNEAEMPESIRRAVQLRAADVLFGEGSATARRIRMEVEMNPFPGKNADDILAMNAAGIIEPLDYFISANISRLIDAAMYARADFMDLSNQEKSEIIKGIAAALLPKKKEISFPPESDPNGNPA